MWIQILLRQKEDHKAWLVWMKSLFADKFSKIWSFLIKLQLGNWKGGKMVWTKLIKNMERALMEFSVNLNLLMYLSQVIMCHIRNLYQLTLRVLH